MLKRFSGVLLAAATLGMTLAAPHAAAQYPTKPVTIIVPFAAGGPTDTVARVMAQAMTKPMGQTVLVENKPGAGGTIASEYVAKSSPDGYTILLHHIGMSTAPALYRTLRFNAIDSFEPIGLVADVPMTLVGRPGLPAKDFKELLAYLKAGKTKVTYANAGIGSASHLCGMLFMSAIDTELTTVPYKGTGPAMNDLLGGQVDIMCDQTTNTTSQIKSGKIHAYAVTTKARVASLKDIPTLEEQGLKGFEVAVWHGFYAPKGTPKPVVDKLVSSLQTALRDPVVKTRFNDLGTDPIGQDKATPAALRAHLKAEIDKWTPLIKKAGV
ncbi:MAG: tripartite tricarboxylate transporter substrate binding protein BugD, partial [Proteobacteria bacterium]|nr:tripartite tricarboxylate transporter substrate binding protein BugD [Pseudomonadota bacterium]